MAKTDWPHNGERHITQLKEAFCTIQTSATPSKTVSSIYAQRAVRAITLKKFMSLQEMMSACRAVLVPLAKLCLQAIKWHFSPHLQCTHVNISEGRRLSDTGHGSFMGEKV